MNYVFTLILVGLVAESQSRDLPIRFRECPRRSLDFPKCMSETVAHAIGSMAKGASNFEIAPLEPLKIITENCPEKTRTDVSMKLCYTNMKVLGLSQSLLRIEYKSIDSDLRQWRFNAYHDRIDISSDYFMDSNASYINMRGNGSAYITMLNVTTKNAIHCEQYEKNGGRFLNVTKYEVKLFSPRIFLRLTELFRTVGADRTLVRREFNENSLVYKNTAKLLEEQFGSDFEAITNKIFSRIPIDNLMPD